MEKNTKLKLWTEWMFEEYFPDLSQEKYLAVDLETCDINTFICGNLADQLRRTQQNR